MNDQNKLSEEQQKKIALKALEDITNLLRLHKLPEDIILKNNTLKDFIIDVYQAGAKMSMQEMDKIFKQAYENIKSPNPDNIPF